MYRLTNCNKDMNKLIVTIFCLLTASMFSCKKPAKDDAFGFSILYMPQAVVQSAGLNNNYKVMVGSSASTDTSVVVGLYRSGLEGLASVSVNLALDADTLTRAMQAAQVPGASSDFNIYKNAKLMPSGYYTLPSAISLENGQRENFVLLNINKQLLLADPDFGTKLFILPLRISNPSMYSINEKLSLTMFIFEKK